MQNISIKKLNNKSLKDALSLIWKVFNEFEAHDYAQEGIEEFYKSIHDEEYLSKLSVFGAFDNETFNGKPVGVIATRRAGSHIALFFVDGAYHRRGIGRRLFEAVIRECRTDRMTVNSSVYAVPVYHKLGFCDTDKQQIVNGIKFTPMELLIMENENCPCRKKECEYHGKCDECRTRHETSKKLRSCAMTRKR